MAGCETCGSVGKALPQRCGYDDSPQLKCQCGFRNRTAICGGCYTRFPHTKDDYGVDVFCPSCDKHVAHFEWSQM